MDAELDSNNPSYYQWRGKDLLVNIYVQPNASRNKWVGQHGGYLKVSLMAPPTDGEANKQLIVFLSKELAVKKSAISILKGEQSRYKRVIVSSPSQLPNVFLK